MGQPYLGAASALKALARAKYVEAEPPLLACQYGRHDDQVDSVSQFLKWAGGRRVADEASYTIGLPIYVGGGEPSSFWRGF